MKARTLFIIGGLVLLLINLPVILAMIMLPMMMSAGGGEQNNSQSCVGSGNYVATLGVVRIPMSGPYTVGSGFGPRFHPIYHEWRDHNGVDLTLKAGPGPILAAMDGTVTSAAYSGDAGNRVIIDHGSGLETVYMHLSAFSVATGDKVQAGQQIGVEGSTGASTAPHLHWGVRINGAWTDPVAWASQQGITVDGTVPQPGDFPATTQPTTAAAAAAPTGTVAGYSGEQLTNAAEIVRAGGALSLDTWTITVGVMTAMGESSLRNITYGDAAGPDSRGLFQQRANGAWGTLEDRMNPYTAATNFFTALVKVPGYHSLEPTIAAHKTQINADPYHYEKYWDPATTVVASILNDPSLVSSLSNQGAGCVTNYTGGVPGMPTDCPPSGMASEGRLQPNALNLLRCVKATFPQIVEIGGWRATAIDMQGHPAGLGLDVMIPNYNTPDGIALGDQIVAWLEANQAKLHPKYMIWRQHHISPTTGASRLMSDRGSPTANHMDHVHITVLP